MGSSSASSISSKSIMFVSFHDSSNMALVIISCWGCDYSM